MLSCVFCKQCPVINLNWIALLHPGLSEFVFGGPLLHAL